MEYGNVQAVEMVFLLLLLFVVVFGELARRLEIPYPVVLVIAGALLGLTPQIPKVMLNPDLVFFVILPPLLYSAAWTTSWRDFRFNLVSILLLAFGLVAFTVIGVAAGIHWLLPAFDWRIGLVLGAVIAPTDAIAATAIAERLGLPKQLRDVLEGESLVNDASGLLALEFGLAIVVGGHAPGVGQGALRLIYLIAVGIVVGLVTGWIVALVERHIDHGPIEIVISILVPYAAYFAADRFHASGVLAVVACGLFLSRRSSVFFSPNVRLQAWAVWDALDFILNSLVFVLIGLQLPHVLAAIHDQSLASLIAYGALFSAFVILLRMIWVFPSAIIANKIRTRILHQRVRRPPSAAIVVAGWSGMRGVIALAAAMALPQTLGDGSPFPQRNFIIFLAFSVILVTLVLQGLTLPVLIRLLGLSEAHDADGEEAAARKEIVEAALAHLAAERQKDESTWDAVYEGLTGHYRQRLIALTGKDDPQNGINPDHHRRMMRLKRELVQLERRTAIRLRDQGRISDETLHELEREFDLREAGANLEHAA